MSASGRRQSGRRRRPTPSKDDDELAVIGTASSGSNGGTAAGTGSASSSRWRPPWRRRPEAADDDDVRLKREWAKIDGMSPPKKPGGVSLPVAVVERRMRSDGYRRYVAAPGAGRTCDQEERRIAYYYLYGRGVGWEVPRRQRKELIESFVGNPKAAARMKRYLAYDTHGSAYSMHSGGLWRSRAQHALWRKGQEVVLWYESPADPRAAGGGGSTILHRGSRRMPYLQLHQGSHTCYLASAFLLVKYNVNLSKLPSQGDDATADESAKSFKAEHLDTNRYIRHRFDNDMLKRRVVDDVGGSSKTVLKELVGSGHELESVQFPKTRRPAILAATSQIVAELLPLHGPALVPCFSMTKVRQLLDESLEEEGDEGVIRLPAFDFHRGVGTLAYRELGKYGESQEFETILNGFESANGGSAHSEDGSVVRNLNHNRRSQSPVPPRGGDSEAVPPPSERAGGPSSHAMVLIGCRRDPAVKGKSWFLLQNPWKGLPLLEVSQAFMAQEMTGKLEFVMGDVSAAVSVFTRQDDHDDDDVLVLVLVGAASSTTSARTTTTAAMAFLRKKRRRKTQERRARVLRPCLRRGERQGESVHESSSSFDCYSISEKEYLDVRVRSHAHDILAVDGLPRTRARMHYKYVWPVTVGLRSALTKWGPTLTITSLKSRSFS
jgi:hypothetical protein